MMLRGAADSGFAGYTLYCDAAEHYIKHHWPDVLLKKVILPVDGPRIEGVFEISVDDEVLAYTALLYTLALTDVQFLHRASA
jgi:hypothetical protein